MDAKLEHHLDYQEVKDMREKRIRDVYRTETRIPCSCVNIVVRICSDRLGSFHRRVGRRVVSAITPVGGYRHEPHHLVFGDFTYG
jgi:hypothetical protein